MFFLSTVAFCMLRIGWLDWREVSMQSLGISWHGHEMTLSQVTRQLIRPSAGVVRQWRYTHDWAGVDQSSCTDPASERYRNFALKCHFWFQPLFCWIYAVKRLRLLKLSFRKSNKNKESVSICTHTEFVVSSLFYISTRPLRSWEQGPDLALD